MVDFRTLANWPEDNIWLGWGGVKWGRTRKHFWDPSSIRLALIETQTPASGSIGTHSYPILYLYKLRKGKNTFMDKKIWDPKNYPLWSVSKRTGRYQVMVPQFRFRTWRQNWKTNILGLRCAHWTSYNGGRSTHSSGSTTSCLFYKKPHNWELPSSQSRGHARKLFY